MPTFCLCVDKHIKITYVEKENSLQSETACCSTGCLPVKMETSLVRKLRHGAYRSQAKPLHTHIALTPIYKLSVRNKVTQKLL
jgi:hypothetical protein